MHNLLLDGGKYSVFLLMICKRRKLLKDNLKLERSAKLQEHPIILKYSCEMQKMQKCRKLLRIFDENMC